ncbi:DUF3052 domain-containing protein [Propionimicrobium lymphophilum]|uniref:DUF3052 domain-containing protein n=1 Tax=Propionimicrobium lymphophilum TaxID=33012 RepID=UPI0003FA2879|nr:DUF3052 domain-containing protein [Propionimicrobium lymphophilum]
MNTESGGKVPTVRQGQTGQGAKTLKDKKTTDSVADLLGLKPGMVVQELGWDEDVDEDLREEIMDAIDDDLIEDAYEAVDVVLLWLRDDTDATDGLVDALRDLSDEGYIWLMTPRIGRDGFIEQVDLSEAADTAGVALTKSVEVSPDWAACKVVTPKGRR